MDKNRTWVVDPLDGTKEFIEGVDHFVVSVALVEKGDPIVGVLYNPANDELFSAAKGDGAFLDGKRLHCSTEKDFKKMEQVFATHNDPGNYDLRGPALFGIGE